MLSMRSSSGVIIRTEPQFLACCSSGDLLAVAAAISAEKSTRWAVDWVGGVAGSCNEQRSTSNEQLGVGFGNGVLVVIRAAMSRAMKVLPEPEGPARRTIFPFGSRSFQSQRGASGGRLARQRVAVMRLGIGILSQRIRNSEASDIVLVL